MVSDMEKTIQCIKEGRAVLGIEFGSTRIKAVLIDEETPSDRPGRLWLGKSVKKRNLDV